MHIQKFILILKINLQKNTMCQIFDTIYKLRLLTKIRLILTLDFHYPRYPYPGLSSETLATSTFSMDFFDVVKQMRPSAFLHFKFLAHHSPPQNLTMLFLKNLYRPLRWLNISSEIIAFKYLKFIRRSGKLTIPVCRYINFINGQFLSPKLTVEFLLIFQFS